MVQTGGQKQTALFHEDDVGDGLSVASVLVHVSRLARMFLVCTPVYARLLLQLPQVELALRGGH